jgi:cell division protein FtsN
MDEDRGTYSPPTEDNLSYQSRRAPSRDQAPLTLIISGIVLVMLLMFVVLFYNSGLNSHGRTPPDVGNSVGDIKDGQVTDAKPLTDAQLGDTGSAKFAPSAEAPQLRDANSAAVDEAPPPVAPIQGPLPSQANNPALNGGSTSPDTTPVPGAGTASNEKTGNDAGRAAIDRALTPGAAAPATKVASASASSAAAKPAKLASSAVSPASSSSASAAPKASPAPKTAEDDAKLAAATAPLHGATVQIGAFQTVDIANKQYANVASSYGLFLGGTSKHIEKVNTSAGATLYRTAFTGFESKDKARAFCDALQAAGHQCLVK